MYYPWLDVPVLTAPMLIAIIALAHVFVSHYAVGGGLLLALENGRALREGDSDYRAYWKKHAKFFIILTVVYGAITGVGIWWTIGLASPLATETLIRTFVFGWAIEWCFFLLEIISGFAFYYFWDKFSPRASSFAGWLYAFSAWISLVLITAITAFMLNSTGLRLDWESTGSFWDAMLNVQFLPQTVARTGGALILGAFYVLLHVSFCEEDSDVREKVTKRMRIPAFLGVFLLVVGVVGWAFFLPESSRATLERAAATNIFAALFVGIVFSVVVLLIVGPCRRPRETSTAFALALFLFGVAGVGVGEFVREAVRKPYVVDRVVYGNQIYKGDVARMRQDGLLYTGVWTNWLLDEIQQKEEYAQLNISAEKFLGRASTHIEKFEAAPVEPDGSQDGETNDQPLPTEGEDAATPDGDLTTGMNETTLFVNETSSLVSYQSDGTSQFTPTATPNGRRGGNLNQAQTRQASQNLASQNGAVSPQRQVGLEETSENVQPQMGSTPLERARQASSGRNVPNQNIQRASEGNGQGNLLQNTNALDNNDQPVPRNDARRTSDAAASSRVVSNDLQDAPETGAQGVLQSDGTVLESDESQEPVEPALSIQEQDEKINGVIGEGNPDLLKLQEDDRLTLGRAVFLYHCNCCHATNFGYSAVAPLIVGHTKEELKDFALQLNHSHYYMPPWAGTRVEAELLAEYLCSVQPPMPKNVFSEPKEKIVPKESTEEQAEGDAESSDDSGDLSSGLSDEALAE